MNYYSQGVALDADFGGSAADVFTVGVEVERVVGLDADTGRGKVVDFADFQMASEIDGGEHAG